MVWQAFASRGAISRLLLAPLEVFAQRRREALLARRLLVRLAAFDHVKEAKLLLSQSKSGNETASLDQPRFVLGETVKTFFIAMLALGALTFRADAQAVKPAVGNEQVYWVLTVSVDKMDEFKSLVGKLVAATEKEPGAMQYEYNVGDDHKTVDIYE
ncbi:MAG TPA: hypothetical protein VF778_05600, partial [Xanthobacteraceae bacterium]